MTAQQSALLVVLPTDDATTVQERLLNSGAQRVQLLVPDGVATLRDPIAARRLAAVAERSGIDLVLISADPPTLRAARMGGLQLLQVDGTPVRAPGTPVDSTGTTTRVLQRPSNHTPLEDELSAGDAVFLDALDDLDSPPVREPGNFDADDIAVSGMLARYRRPAPPEADWRPPVSNDDADLAAALDSLDDLPPTRPTPRRQTESTYSPAPVAVPPARPVPQPTPLPRERPQREPIPQPTPSAHRSRRNWLLPLLSLLLIVLLVAIGTVLVMSGITGPRVTLVVSPPTPPELIDPVTDLPVPIVPPGSQQVDTAVAAAPLTLNTVDVRVDSPVTETTLEPVGFAGGTVQVLSLNNQPITLPAGTEFIAVKPDGQEVAFISNTDTVVPPSTTSDQGAQIITSRGVANVPVSARSPGSASNVDANSIRRMTIPGGGTFSVESGALIVRHDPLLGGTESEVLLVKESDVRQALGPALTALDAEGRRQLQEAAANAGLQIEEGTITPSRSDLEQLSGFQYNVIPAVGSRLDPGVTQFTVQVSAAYAALATPLDQPLAGPALQNAFTEQLRQSGRLTPGDCRAPTIEDLRWDGSTLFVSGSIGPDPRCGRELSAEARQQVLAAVLGKSVEEARVALDELQTAGVIGGYTLPDVTSFPEREQQIELVIE